MSTRTTTGKGLERPHKHEAAKPGIGASMANARTIKTEQGGHKPKVGTGLPHSYFGNSRAIDTARGQK